MKDSALEMVNIFKSFSTTEVLHNVDFTLNVGEKHGLVGQNGAGKSTLMKILNGVERKDSGIIKISGKEVEYDNPIKARRKGISMIIQEISHNPARTVSAAAGVCFSTVSPAVCPGLNVLRMISRAFSPRSQAC